MSKKTTLKGMWWVKGHEQNKFMGILSYGGGYVPTLEIFPKSYDYGEPFIPNSSTIYGDVFRESSTIQAVTLLDCRSRTRFGQITVGAYLYKQEFVSADCVAIGLLLDDSEIAQVKAPQTVFLTCPGLDEYGIDHTMDFMWKDGIPKGRAYRINDIDKIVYTQPDPIAIEIDVGTITISVAPSSTAKDLTLRYSIHIGLDSPMPEADVNALIYSQMLSFLSIMTGRSEHIEKHKVSIYSDQIRSDSLSIELSYGHTAHMDQDAQYSIWDTLVLGGEATIRKFATLFPKWRENFASVEDLAFHYGHMVAEPTETNLLQAFPLIETYVLERLLGQNKKGMFGILNNVIHCIADHFSYSKIYNQHFPANQIEHTASQLANFRHKRIHPTSEKECEFSLDEVYAYIDVIFRSIFLREMEYPREDIDGAIGHWPSWHVIDEK